MAKVREALDRIEHLAVATPAMSEVELGAAMASILRHVAAASEALSVQPAERTLLEQYDLEQSPDYRKGYEDGRLKGFEVGQRYAAPQPAPSEPAAPDVWQLVPKEPTPEMLKKADQIIGPDPRFMVMTWRAMLAAAPHPAAKGAES